MFLAQISLQKSSTSNLMKHIKIKHPKEHELFEAASTSRVQHGKRSATLSTSAEPKLKQQKLNLSPNILLQKCSELVTNHGRPLSIFADKAMQDILSLIPGNVKIYPEKVRCHIEQQAAALREKASKALGNKLLSLEFDFAECMGRSFLGKDQFDIL